MPLRRIQPPGRVALCLAMILTLFGCSKWQVEQGSPATLLGYDPPGAIRVERHDGSVVELIQAKVESDTLSGLVPGSAPPGMPFRRVSIPLSDVQRLASRRSDTRRTIGAFLTGPLVYIAGGFLMRFP
jgi:hypothetical protein